MKFTKAKRRFDVTAKVSTPVNGVMTQVLESTFTVWAHGPELSNIIDPICDHAQVKRGPSNVTILYIREHELHEYTPAQLGKMMAQEGIEDAMLNNPYLDERDPRNADLWEDAFRSELEFIRRRR